MVSNSADLGSAVSGFISIAIRETWWIRPRCILNKRICTSLYSNMETVRFFPSKLKRKFCIVKPSNKFYSCSFVRWLRNSVSLNWNVACIIYSPFGSDSTLKKGVKTTKIYSWHKISYERSLKLLFFCFASTKAHQCLYSTYNQWDQKVQA